MLDTQLVYTGLSFFVQTVPPLLSVESDWKPQWRWKWGCCATVLKGILTFTMSFSSGWAFCLMVCRNPPGPDSSVGIILFRQLISPWENTSSTTTSSRLSQRWMERSPLCLSLKMSLRRIAWQCSWRRSTISIKSDKKAESRYSIGKLQWKHRSLEVQPTSFTKEKCRMTRNNRRKQHWSRSCDRNVSKIVMRNGKSEMMDSLESEEERENKLEETSEGKPTRPSDDAMFFRREIIDAITRSDEKMETYSKKADGKMDTFDEQWRITGRKQMNIWTRFCRQLTIQSDPSLHGMNTAFAKNEGRRRRQIRTNQWKNRECGK